VKQERNPDMRKNGPRILTVCVFLSFTAAGAGAQTFGRPVEDARLVTAMATTPVSGERPPLGAIDGNSGTAWGAPQGSTLATIVVGLEQPRLIAGLKILGHLEADTTLTVSWLDGLSSYSFFGGNVSGGLLGDTVLDLSLERAFTDRLLISLSGPSAASSYISELTPMVFGQSVLRRYLAPADITPSHGALSVFTAEWLADGDVRSAWRAGPWARDPNPGSIMGSLGTEDAGTARRNAGRAARLPRHGDADELSVPFAVGANQGGAVFSYDEEVSVDRVKIYFEEGARGDAVLKVDTASGWAVFASMPASQVHPGWVVNDLSIPVRGKRFMLLSSGPHGDVGGIGELELWGMMSDHGPIVITGEAMRSMSPGEPLHRLVPEKKDLYALELSATGFTAQTLAVKVNGVAAVLKRAGEAGGRSLFRTFLDTTAMDTEELWLSIPAVESLGVEFSRLRLVENVGELAGPAESPLFDGVLLKAAEGPSTQQWELGRMLATDAIEIRGPFAGSASVRVRSGGAWTDLVPLVGQGLTTFPCAMTIDALEVISFGPLSEISLQGSPTADRPPVIRVILPDGETAKENGFLICCVYDPLAAVTVNGRAPQRYGQFFAVRLGDVDPDSDIDYHVLIRVVDAAGRVATLERSWYRWGYGPLFVDQASSLKATSAPSLQVTGRTTGQVWGIEVNGSPVMVTQNRFGVSVPLDLGFNAIIVAARRRSTGEVSAVRVVRAIRYDTTFGIKVTSPLPSSFISRSSALVGGRLIGAVAPVKVSVNGTRAWVRGDQFAGLGPLSLREGENLIVVHATDGLGRTSETSSRVTVDTIKPSVSFLEPQSGACLPSSVARFKVHVQDATAVTVTVDGILSLPSQGDFTVNVSYKDGAREITALATDAAGNTGAATIRMTVDTTPPEAFTAEVSPVGWTSNTTPLISFAAADATSGVARYEVSVDGTAMGQAASPHFLPALADGTHSIVVTVFDRAGNTRSAQVYAFIDTTPSPPPISFRGVPGPGQVRLVWEMPAEDVVRYTIRRTAAWDGGTRATAAESLTDIGLADGMQYSYQITATDRAGNVSAPSDCTCVVGKGKTQVAPGVPGAVVEFQDLTLYFPQEALPEGVKEIDVTTVQSEQAAAQAVFGMTSPIYSFTALVDGPSGLEEREGVEFSKDYVGILCYDQSEVPEGFPEENMGLYYWDTTWSKWFLVEKHAVDVEKNTVVFSTSHFTLFSVQPTVISDLSPQELKDVGFSPFKAKVTQGGVSVSTQGGSAMTESVDFVLPGKAGFDLILKRTYDTATARGDSPGLALNAALSFSLGKIVENAADLSKLVSDDTLPSILNCIGDGALSQLQAKIRSIFESYGDYAYSTGVGWRLNFPYIRSAGAGVLVRTPSGAFFPVNNMELKSNTSSRPLNRELVFENHESEDFTFIVHQSAALLAIFTINKPKVIPSWSLDGATLILKDGTRYTFDRLGRVQNIFDGTGQNAMAFSYGGPGGYFLDAVTDSMGRVLRFAYDGGNSNSIIPRIVSITLEGDPQRRKVQYSYTDRTIDGGWNPLVPLLASATDSVGRTWTYGYDRTVLLQGSVSIKVNFAALILEACGLGWMTGSYLPSAFTLSGHLNTEIAYSLGSMAGPGVGYVRVNSDRSTLVYAAGELTDYVFGFIPTGLQGSLSFPTRFFTASVHEYDGQGGSLLRGTSYSYSFIYSGFHQVSNTRTVVNDERTSTTYMYGTIQKQRRTYLTSEDWLMSLTQGVVMNPLTNTEVIPYETSSLVHSLTGALIETAALDYNPDAMRLTSRTVSRGSGHSSSLGYVHDGWGNVLQSTESTVDGLRSTTKTTTSRFFVQPCIGGFPNIVPAGSPYSLPALAVPRMDLLLSRRVDYSIPTLSGSESTGSSVTYFDYDTLGRKTAETAVVSGRNLETRYEYDACSELTRLTMPVKTGDSLVTRMERDYSPPAFYTVRSIQEGVDLAQGSSTDIETMVWYERYSGLPRFERDGRGFITVREYDGIGRPTRTVKPADDDPPYADPLQGTSFMADNPSIFVSYNDSAFDVTVTGQRGQVAVYDFDEAGRLLGIEKRVRLMDSNGSPLDTNLQVQITRAGYDGFGNVTSITDPNGNRTDYGYDVMGRLSRITYPPTDGARASKTMSFDYSTNTQTTTDERGYVTVEHFDMAGRKTETCTYPDQPGAGGGLVTTSTYYDGIGREAISIDALGGISTRAYDERGCVTQVQTPIGVFFEAGVESLFTPRAVTTYDDAGAKSGETLFSTAARFQTRYATNKLGQPLSRERAYTDYSFGVETASIARELYSYDQNGNKISEVDANDSSQPREARRPRTTEYSARGKVLSVIDRAGSKTTYEYDGDDNLTRVTDPRGNDAAYAGNFSARFWYDDASRLVRALVPSAAGGTAAAAVSFEYDPRGNLLKRTDADGSITEFMYSARNKPLLDIRTDRTGGASISTRHVYDRSALEIQSISGGLYTTTKDYDGLSRVVQVTLPSGSYQKTGYDPAGNLSWVENARGHVTSFIYDSYTRLLAQTDAAGSKRRLSYDTRGNLTREIDANGNTRLMSYDELGRLIKESRADGATYLWGYDAVGNMCWSRDAAGIETTCTYTDDYHPSVVTKSNGSREQGETYTWDRGGNRRSATSGAAGTHYNGDGSSYASDPYGRVRKINATIGGTAFSANINYDEAGHLTRLRYPSAREQDLSYDGIGQLSEVTGWTLPGSMRRDAAGKILGYTLSNNVESSAGWDPDGRLSRLGYRGPQAGMQLPGYLFGYDMAGNLVNKSGNLYGYDELERLCSADESDWSKESMPALAGSVREDHRGQGELVYGSAETVLELDHASTSIGADLGAERDLMGVELIPDSPAHRVKARSVELWVAGENGYKKVSGAGTRVNEEGHIIIELGEPVVSTRFKVHCLYDQRDEYDQALDFASFRNQAGKLLVVSYRLKGQRASYGYDSKGNRLWVTTTKVEVGTTTNRAVGVSYWPSSDRLMRYGEWTCVYDGSGNLLEKGTSYTEGKGFSETNGTYMRYEWDLFGRLEKVSRSTAGQAGAEVLASYGYDADGMRVMKRTRAGTTIWLYGPDGNPIVEQSASSYTREYVYAEGRLFGYWETRGAVTRKYFTLTDQIGSVVSTTDQTGAEVSKRDYSAFGSEAGAQGTTETVALFAGKEWDAEAGLYYFNARWYDPELGRFISEDPSKDGENWYVYCENNPLTHTDPTGLEQNFLQNLFAKALEKAASKSDVAREFIQKNTDIEIQRNSNDQGRNNNYYQSDLSVAFLGIPLNNVKVQSTADMSKAKLKELGGRTLDPGEYTATLATQSPSYLKPIVLTGSFFIHPDQFTNPTKVAAQQAAGKSSGPWPQPFSAGCQITSLPDFNEIVDVLESLRFNFDDKSTVDVVIKPPKEK
jgi:RHS repeat-associated protein